VITEIKVPYNDLVKEIHIASLKGNLNAILIVLVSGMELSFNCENLMTNDWAQFVLAEDEEILNCFGQADGSASYFTKDSLINSLGFISRKFLPPVMQ